MSVQCFREFFNETYFAMTAVKLTENSNPCVSFFEKELFCLHNPKKILMNI